MYQVPSKEKQETIAKERLDSFAAWRLCEQKEAKLYEVPSTCLRKAGNVPSTEKQETIAKERLDSFAALRLCEQKEPSSPPRRNLTSQGVIFCVQND